MILVSMSGGLAPPMKHDSTSSMFPLPFSSSDSALIWFSAQLLLIFTSTNFDLLCSASLYSALSHCLVPGVTLINWQNY